MVLVVDSDQHAIEAFHLELIRVNEAQSRIEQFDMKKKYMSFFFSKMRTLKLSWMTYSQSQCLQRIYNFGCCRHCGRQNGNVHAITYIHARLARETPSFLKHCRYKPQYLYFKRCDHRHTCTISDQPIFVRKT